MACRARHFGIGMTLVTEEYKVLKPVNAHPGNRLVLPCVARDFPDGWASGGNGLMAGHADRGRGQAGRLTGGCRLVAHHTGDILFAMLLVAERDGLRNRLGRITARLRTTCGGSQCDRCNQEERDGPTAPHPYRISNALCHQTIRQN